MQDVFELSSEDRVLQKTVLHFDVSLWEIFLPLVSGARLVLADPWAHRDPIYLRDTIRAQEITVIHFVPAMLRAFLAEENVESVAPFVA